MSRLLLQTKQQSNITIVSNQFIDTYMCHANGEFVKVYLYLLRCVSSPPDGFSPGYIADHLNMTESDVMRALHYWTKEGLLDMTVDKGQALTSLILNCPESVSGTAASRAQTSATQETAIQARKPTEPFLYTHNEKQPQRQSNKNDTVIQDIALIAEQYLARPLTAVDVDKIAFFYEKLHFSPDLIEYLFEHCVTIGNRSMRYIESVAIAWRDKHITTVEQAKAEGAHYRREYFQILKAFGITSRTPIENEVTYMKRWMDEYHFTVEVIAEACQRTIAKTGNVSFPYAESILKNWREHGILAKRDIAALDEAHFARKREQEAAAAAQPKTKPNTGSRFNNFEQRSYDFDQLERALNQIPT